MLIYTVYVLVSFYFLFLFEVLDWTKDACAESPKSHKKGM